MNCEFIYSSLIGRAKGRVIDRPFERHHIIPKSLGGSDDKDNIVALTPREHFVAHILLARMHKGKMLQAFHFMASKGGVKIHSRLYEKARSVVVEEARKKGAILASEKRGVCGRSAEKMSEDGRKAGKAGGAKQKELKIGIHAQTIEEKRRIGLLAHKNKTGIHSLSAKQTKENSKKGCEKRALMIAEGELVVFTDPERVRSLVRETNKRIYECSCGYRSRACGVGLHQKKTGHTGKALVQ